MSSAALRLRTIINNPSTLDMTKEWVALDDRSPPTLFVYGESLSNAVLRSEAIATYDLFVYWKAVTQVNPPGYPAIETYFHETPFFLHGEAHRSARKALAQPYRSVEAGLDQWLPVFAENFFKSFQQGQSIKPNHLALSFIEDVFREMLAREAGRQANDFPPLPRTLFNFLPRLKFMQEYDAQLTALVDVLKKSLSHAERDPNEAWALASIVVMGQQPLLSALVYGLMNKPPVGDRWDGEALMRQTAPVSVLGREAREEVTIRGLKLAKGQPLHICPFLTHMHADVHAKDDAAKKSIAFGAGPHVCSGRKISLKITDAFFSQWARADHIHLDTSGVSLVRDFVLTPQEKT